MIGDLRAWGWVTLIIAILQLVAGGGVLAGNELARWFAVAILGISAIEIMFFIPAYPLWALVIIAIDVVALYGLCATAAARTWPTSSIRQPVWTNGQTEGNQKPSTSPLIGGLYRASPHHTSF